MHIQQPIFLETMDSRTFSSLNEPCIIKQMLTRHIFAGCHSKINLDILKLAEANASFVCRPGKRDAYFATHSQAIGTREHGGSAV